MSERVGSRKRKAEAARASKEPSVPELLPALDPNGDPPSDPDLVVRPVVKSTVLPPPAEPPIAASREGLVRMVRGA